MTTLFNDETWHTVAAEVQRLLDLERGRMENASKPLNFDETNISRGKISAWKELLALPKNMAARAKLVDPA